MADFSDVTDVFISYRRSDIEFVKKLVDSLEDCGKDVWVDWQDIPPGSSDFQLDLKQGIENTGSFICVITPEYLASSYCMDLELKYALTLNKKIIPVIPRPFDYATITKEIGHINWIYFTPHAGQENSYEESLARVLQAMDADLEHSRSHRRILVRALEWNNANRRSSFLLRGEEILTAENWLANAAGKQPLPAELHKEYIAASRAADRSRQRLLLTSVSLVGVFAVILAIFSLVQRSEAEFQRNAAQQRETEAKAQLISRQLSTLARSDPQLAYKLGIAVMDVADLSSVVHAEISHLFYSQGLVNIFKSAHGRGITAMDYNSKTGQIISASYDGDLKFWNADGSSIVLDAHEDWITDVAFSPDGSQVASASIDGTVKIWQVQPALSRLPIKEIPVDLSEWVTSLAYSMDGKRLAAGTCATRPNGWRCSVGRIVIWDTVTGLRDKSFEGHGDFVTSVAFTLDDAILISGGRDGKVILWDMEKGTEKFWIAAHFGGVQRIAVMSDTRFVSAGQDGYLRVWGLEDDTNIFAKEEPGLLVHDIAADPKAGLVITGQSDNQITLWRWRDEQLVKLRTLVGHGDAVRAVVYNSDTDRILSGSLDGNLIEWDAQTKTEAREIVQIYARHKVSVFDTAFSPDFTLGLSASLDNTVILWDIATGKRLDQKTVESSATSVEFSDDGQQAFAAFSNGIIARWNVGENVTGRKGLLETDQTIVYRHDDWITDLVLLGDQLLFSSRDGTVALVNIENGQVIREYNGSPISSIAISPDNKSMLTGSDDRTMQLWDIENGTLKLTFQGHIDRVTSVAFSPDGTKIVSGSEDTTIKIWNLNGRASQELIGHTAAVQQVKFLDNTRVLSTSSDGTVIVWDSNTSEPLWRFTGQNGAIYSVDVAADNTLLLGTEDGVMLHIRLLRDESELQAWNPYQLDGLSCEDHAKYRVPGQCSTANTQ